MWCRPRCSRWRWPPAFEVELALVFEVALFTMFKVELATMFEEVLDSTLPAFFIHIHEYFAVLEHRVDQLRSDELSHNQGNTFVRLKSLGTWAVVPSTFESNTVTRAHHSVRV